jgi:hypothetical protein
VKIGALQQMRPVLMACFAAGLGLMPAAVINSIGAQAQQPLARVVVEGMVVCPANFVPVAMIGTGSKGAVYGTREEAWSRTGGEPVAAD